MTWTELCSQLGGRPGGRRRDTGEAAWALTSLPRAGGSSPAIWVSLRLSFSADAFLRRFTEVNYEKSIYDLNHIHISDHRCHGEQI